MAELLVVNPTGKIIIHEDKTMSITSILRNQPSQATLPVGSKEKSLATYVAATNTDSAKPTLSFAAPTPKTNIEKIPVTSPISETSHVTLTEKFPVSIEAVRIENADLDFADLSLVPQFGAHITSLTGIINGVSTNAAAIAQIELDGKVDDYGSASIRGSVQPFQATNFTDLKLSFKNLKMSRLTPYSGKFSGRRIDSGKLSVDLEYKIKQRQFAGDNKFIINQLKLGEKVDSAEAANLPLDLAIAILGDSDCVIDFDLQISDSLDDPKFSYGGIVWKAIKNVLSKIVTSPFRALGKLFGADSEKPEAISFEAGSAVLAPPEQEKLKLQETILRSKVAQEIGIKLADGKKPGPIDLSNQKTQKAIDSLYDTLTKKSLLKNWPLH